MLSLKEARQYAYDLICDGKKDYCNLDNDEKEKLTGLIIQATEKIHIWEYITEADFKNDLPNLLAKLLETGDETISNELINTLKNNAVLYASKEAIRILEEQLAEYNYNKQYEREE